MKSQKGNALFLILIAVALFAALSYAITNSSRGSSSVDKEQASLQASRLMQYFAQVEAEFTKIRVIGGYDITEIDFGSDVFSRWGATVPNPWFDNPNCTSNNCRIFQSNGGNVPDITFEDIVIPLTTAFSSSHPHHGHPFVARADVVSVGTTSQDLVLGVIRLEREVCDAINRALGLSITVADADERYNAIGVPGGRDLTNFNYWSLDATALSEQIGNQETAFQGQLSGCYRGGGTYGYTYYHVLVAR